jgi:hypothetical protein
VGVLRPLEPFDPVAAAPSVPPAGRSILSLGDAFPHHVGATFAALFSHSNETVRKYAYFSYSEGDHHLPGMSECVLEGLSDDSTAIRGFAVRSVENAGLPPEDRSKIRERLNDLRESGTGGLRDRAKRTLESIDPEDAEPR